MNSRIPRRSVLARALCAAILYVAVNACGGSSSPAAPTAPTPPPATRVVTASGDLRFSETLVGSSRESTLSVGNNGTGPLTVTSITVTGNINGQIEIAWPGGQIAVGTTQLVTIRFVPQTFGTFTGNLLVNGDQTSGSNSIAVTGSSTTSHTGRWVGGHRVDECRGYGSAQDLICFPGRGVAPPGSIFLFEANLVQSGNSVTGTLNLGGIVGPVTGFVADRGNTGLASGLLTLRGTLTSTSGYTAVITGWNTHLGTATSWSGSFTVDETFRGINGVATIVSSVNNVTKR